MPFGIFSMPNTSTESYWPARMAAAPSTARRAPDAQPASMSTIGPPVRPSCAEHAVAGGHAAVGGAAERGLEGRCPVRPRRAPGARPGHPWRWPTGRRGGRTGTCPVPAIWTPGAGHDGPPAANAHARSPSPSVTVVKRMASPAASASGIGLGQQGDDAAGRRRAARRRRSRTAPDPGSRAAPSAPSSTTTAGPRSTAAPTSTSGRAAPRAVPGPGKWRGSHAAARAAEQPVVVEQTLDHRRQF